MATWTPTAAEVHAVIATRNGGDPFDAGSTPTKTEVESLATSITAEVIAKVAEFGGSTAITGADIEAQAKWAVKLGTAAYVELNYFPEQQAVGDQSVAPQLFARYDDAVDLLRSLIRASDTGDAITPTAFTIHTPSAAVEDWPWYLDNELLP